MNICPQTKIKITSEQKQKQISLANLLSFQKPNFGAGPQADGRNFGHSNLSK